MGHAGRNCLSGVGYRLREDFDLYFKRCKQYKIYIAETKNVGLTSEVSPFAYFCAFRHDKTAKPDPVEEPLQMPWLN
mgnify:CR=1 FL=1